MKQPTLNAMYMKINVKKKTVVHFFHIKLPVMQYINRSACSLHSLVGTNRACRLFQLFHEVSRKILGPEETRKERAGLCKVLHEESSDLKDIK